jgi:hypothetical protein
LEQQSKIKGKQKEEKKPRIGLNLLTFYSLFVHIASAAEPIAVSAPAYASYPLPEGLYSFLPLISSHVRLMHVI